MRTLPHNDQNKLFLHAVYAAWDFDMGNKLPIGTVYMNRKYQSAWDNNAAHQVYVGLQTVSSYQNCIYLEW